MRPEDFNWTIISICLVLLAFFCAMTFLVENRKDKIRRRARRIYGKVRYRDEAVSVDDVNRFNFRHTRWGMTPEMVKLAEKQGELQHESPDCLSYCGHIYKQPCGIDYRFKNGQLNEVRGLVRMNFPQAETYLNLFNRLVKRLMRSYGLPSAWDVFWADNVPPHTDFGGEALENGWAWCSARWATPRTFWLSLQNIEGRISLSLHCQARCGGSCAR